MSNKRRKTSRSATVGASLKCEDASFAEIAIPTSITPRLVIRCSEGLSLLIENQSAIPLAAEFIIAFRILEEGGAL
jgi:hypothetical protein